MTEVNVNYANMAETNLVNVNLTSAKLQHTNLRHADFHRSTLKYADLESADLAFGEGLNSADLTGVYAYNANFVILGTDCRATSISPLPTTTRSSTSTPAAANLPASTTPNNTGNSATPTMPYSWPTACLCSNACQIHGPSTRLEAQSLRKLAARSTRNQCYSRRQRNLGIARLFCHAKKKKGKNSSMSYEIPPGQRTDNPTLDQACAMAYEFAVENEKIGRHTFTMRQLNQLANLYKVEDYSEIAHDDRTAIGQEFADYLDSAIVEQEIITPSLAAAKQRSRCRHHRRVTPVQRPQQGGYLRQRLCRAVHPHRPHALLRSTTHRLQRHPRRRPIRLPIRKERFPMNPPYTSLRQLVEATLEKFKEATSLYAPTRTAAATTQPSTASAAPSAVTSRLTSQASGTSPKSPPTPSSKISSTKNLKYAKKSPKSSTSTPSAPKN